MAEKINRHRLLTLFKNFTNKTTIVEPISTTHGTLRDEESIEREISLIISEMLERDVFTTTLTSMQLSRLIVMYFAGIGDNKIARAFGGEHLDRTVGRARIRLKLFRDFDFNIPFTKEKMNHLVASGKTLKEISTILGVSNSSFRHFKHVYDSSDDVTIDPYMERIKAVIEDRDLGERMTSGMIKTGLSDTIDITESELVDDIHS